MGPSPDRSKLADQPPINPRSQERKREVGTDSRESEAAVKGRRWTAASPTPPEPKQCKLPADRKFSTNLAQAAQV